ncbi:Protein phosphatase 1 regulatory subunit 3C [Smittium mucronatum]|uniref:Protein phosphatase 1 regulatory subunit 3C n=1 Tax=Smittium mucronatum TaxID=133383 RepID=A0A1R0GTW5_9FUNG|nr:Protein phosphatase 1 regulatory subunit 3C [Smittium mucronatum]
MYISAGPVRGTPSLVNGVNLFNLSKFPTLKTDSKPKTAESNSNLDLKPCMKSSKVKSRRKKSVHFSDTLESSMPFFKCEEPAACSEKYKPESPCTHSMSKLQSIRGPNKLPINYSQPILLDSIRLDSDVNMIYGNARVLNISFEKNVIVRYTTDSWESFKEAKADFSKVLSSSSDGLPGVDCFSFVIELPTPEPSTRSSFSDSINFPTIRKFEFCLKYVVNGSLYWDSNSGNNYAYNVISYTPSFPAKRDSSTVGSSIAASPPDFSLHFKPSVSRNPWELNKPKELVFSSKSNFIQQPSSFSPSKPIVSSGLKHCTSNPILSSKLPLSNGADIPWTSVDYTDFSHSASVGSSVGQAEPGVSERSHFELPSLSHLSSSFNSSQPPIFIKKNKKDLSSTWLSHSPPNFSPPQHSYFASTQC